MKKSRSFRLTDLTMQKLNAITQRKNKESKEICDDLGLKFNTRSNADILELIINDYYNDNLVEKNKLEKD